MKRIFALTAAAMLVGGLSAWAAETSTPTAATGATHSTDSMTAGMHTMAGQKQMHMSDKAMPSQSPKCSDEALATMPAEHRAACGKKD
jgi:hypothetical protein